VSEKQSGEKPRRVGDGTPGPGRKKGVPNKTTTALKEAILLAAERAGDTLGEQVGAEGGTVGYLTSLAIREPTAFATLLGKVLPMQVTGEDGKAIAVTWLKPDAS
jgi:hypothetical protein